MKTLPLILACLLVAALLGCQEGKKPAEAAQDQAPPAAPQASPVYVDRNSCFDVIREFDCSWTDYSPEEKKKQQAEFVKGTALSITHLGKADLRYQMIELDPKELPNKREPNREGTPTSNPRITLTLDSELKIYLTGYEKYEYWPENDLDSTGVHHSEIMKDLIVLTIGNRRFYIDSLLNPSEFDSQIPGIRRISIKQPEPGATSLPDTVEYIDLPLNAGRNQFGMSYAYKFFFQNKTYFLLYPDYAIGLIDPSPHPSPILIEFTTPDDYVFYVWRGDHFQSTESPFRFNDFDGDGNLDYLWAYLPYMSMPGADGKAQLYSLTDGQYVLREDAYIGYEFDTTMTLRVIAKKTRWPWR